MTLTLSAFRPRLTAAALPPAVVPAFYVHVPFCFHKCHYCDFYSITRQSEERMTAFVARLLAEADQWTKPETGLSLCPQTVFFGGGTPSLLPLPQMRALIDGLRSRFDFSALSEWTVECNPATVTADYCHMLRDAGVTRLSFGAQSFDQRELAMLERHHNPADVPRSVEIARKAGFSRINLDLIFAIPGQSMESWTNSLETTLALGTQHVSCYALTYEPNTPMAVKKRMGAFQPAEEALELEMLAYTRERLSRAGLFAYEISNFAAPGEECRHNLMYWRGQDYIGLGPSAASHVQGHRWKNRPHLGEWESAIDCHDLPATDYESLDAERRARELAMLMLRLREGIEFEYFLQKTDQDARQLFADPITRYTRAGLLNIDNHGVKLTEAGVAVADAIASEFLR